MLVTFSCNAYANITMFGADAVRLLELMGHRGTVPGALLAENVPAALASLEAAVAANEQLPEAEESGQSVDEEPPVSLSRRALPVIELLKAAVKSKSDVMWDKNS